MGKGRQCFTAVACSFSSLVVGLYCSWPSYTLDQFTAANTTLLSSPMSEVNAALVGSLPSLGAMLGTVIASPLINKVGRQKGGVLIALPALLSWSMIALTKSSIVMLIARFICGIIDGAGLVYGPIFVSETAQDSIRGALSTGSVAFLSLGFMLSYTLDCFLTYWPILWINLAASVINVILNYMVVESPLYLLRQNKEEEARQAIAKYRSVDPDSKTVLEEICRIKVLITPAVQLVPTTDESYENTERDTENERLQVEDEKQPYDQAEKVQTKITTIKILFKSTASRRAFIIVGTAMSTQVFMGMIPVMVYAKTLLEKAAPNLSSNLCSVLLAVILGTGCAVSALLTDRIGRRILIISSSILVALFVGSLGFFLQTGFGPAWISAVLIFIYCFFFNFGAGTIPYVLLAESFVPEVQGLASMMLVEWVYFLNFVIIAIFPFASKLIGIHGVFYVFAIIGCINAVQSYFSVPETKGLSKEQIQEAYLRLRRK